METKATLLADLL